MITQGYLSRHFQGRHGMADAALLDVAQDYALKHIHDQGLFDLGVVLKGGTALRKLRAGNAGRFSTDLDFMAPDADTAALAFDTLDGAELFDVSFKVEQRDALRAKLVVDTPLGQPGIPARLSSRFVRCGSQHGVSRLWLCRSMGDTSSPSHLSLRQHWKNLFPKSSLLGGDAKKFVTFTTCSTLVVEH